MAIFSTFCKNLTLTADKTIAAVFEQQLDIPREIESLQRLVKTLETQRQSFSSLVDTENSKYDQQIADKITLSYYLMAKLQQYQELTQNIF